MLEQGGRGPDDEARVSDEVNRYLGNRVTGEGLLSIDLLGRDGKIIASSVPKRISRDDSKERYYQKVLGGEEYVTDFHVEEGDQMGLGIAVSVLGADNHQEIVGALVGLGLNRSQGGSGLPERHFWWGRMEG